METKYAIVFILFGVAVLVVLFSERISKFFQFFKGKRPERNIQFTDSIQLKWGDYFWEGQTVLSSWEGFQERLGPYSFVSSSAPSKGVVRLSVSSPDNNLPSPPSEAQLKGFCFVRDADKLLQEKVLKAVFDVYPAWRENSKDFLGEDLEEQMPALHAPSDLKPLIGLSTIHVLNVEKDGLAYVGFEFGCTWDEEHGLGVMTHAGHVIEVGSADESFSEGTAEENKLSARRTPLA